ncbi:MAG TPA: glycosyltransferase family 9 protein [Clostridiales bacterium]|nr:glycosyltransferase family 9 protein [Clostridiales bacterium]HQP70739.1 glycosyltransferase family 9 protein [Clostridiales bacterium]
MNKKCLIFFTIGIGDSLMVTPVLNKIKSLDGYEFHALTISPQIKEIMENSGCFKRVYLINFLKDKLTSSFSLLCAVEKEKYDLSILVYPSNHYKYRIVHFLTGSKKRYGISYGTKNFPDLEFLSGKLIKEDRSLHAIEQNFRLFETALNIKLERDHKMTLNISDTDRKIADGFVSSHSLNGKTLIGIHPGSDLFKNMEKKRWDPVKYSALMKSYSDNDKVHFLIFGSKPENLLMDAIHSGSSANSTAVKNTPFFHSAAIIEKCGLFICGDTGLMHTAAALNVPVIAIFGPTSSVYAGPLNEGSAVIKKDYACIPCFEYSRTPLKCVQQDQYKCIKDISVEDVKTVLDSKLKEQEK